MKSINPIICVVTLQVLSKTQIYNFQHTCSTSELTELQENLNVEKLLSFSFKGRLVRQNNKRYELRASFTATTVQNCIVTWKPIKAVITDKIERHYSEEQVEHKVGDVSLDINSKDLELIRKELNIGAVVIEALCLAIPDYPRKKNVRFAGATITSSGLKPLDKNLSNPFLILKDFLNK